MHAILPIAEAPPPEPERRPLLLPVRVVLVLLIAAILVFLAFLVFVLPARDDADICRDICDGPSAILGKAVRIDATHWEIEVEGICDYDRRIASYKVVLLRNGTVADTQDPLSGVSDSIIFIDEDGDGCVSAGDFFTVYCDPSRIYKLALVGKDSGNEIGSETWETWPNWP